MYVRSWALSHASRRHAHPTHTPTSHNRLEGIHAIVEAAREDRRSEAIAQFMQPPPPPTPASCPRPSDPHLQFSRGCSLTPSLLGALLARASSTADGEEYDDDGSDSGGGNGGRHHLSTSSVSSLTSSTPRSDAGDGDVGGDSPPHSLACSRQGSFEHPQPPTRLPWGGCVPTAYLCASLQQQQQHPSPPFPSQQQPMPAGAPVIVVPSPAAAGRGRVIAAAAAAVAAPPGGLGDGGGVAKAGVRAKACLHCHTKKGRSVRPWRVLCGVS